MPDYTNVPLYTIAAGATPIERCGLIIDRVNGPTRGELWLRWGNLTEVQQGQIAAILAGTPEAAMREDPGNTLRRASEDEDSEAAG